EMAEDRHDQSKRKTDLTGNHAPAGRAVDVEKAADQLFGEIVRKSGFRESEGLLGRESGDRARFEPLLRRRDGSEPAGIAAIVVRPDRHRLVVVLSGGDRLVVY